MRGRPNTVKTFLTRFEVDDGTGCWNWQGAISQGYGQVAMVSMTKVHRPVRIHRISWAIANNNCELPPPSQHIHHLCGNKRCGNPDHLEAVAPSEHAHIHHGHGCHKHGLEERSTGLSLSRKVCSGKCTRGWHSFIDSTGVPWLT